jgi:uncharacterized protein YbjT (DUF2867 family)
MGRKILVLGGLGTAGKPVVEALAAQGHLPRLLVRDSSLVDGITTPGIEVVEGDVRSSADLRRTMNGCFGVHISLPAEVELPAAEAVKALGPEAGIRRITYVSGTSVREEHRWFPLVDRKMRAEEAIRGSGIPSLILCPTWLMETLPRFVRNGGATVISGPSPARISFLAGEDFGRTVAAAYEKESVWGKRLFLHGPEAFTLAEALAAYVADRNPPIPLSRLRLWQASFLARFRPKMAPVVELIRYFETVGELGDPGEADGLLGPPRLTLGDWILRKELEPCSD